MIKRFLQFSITLLLLNSSVLFAQQSSENDNNDQFKEFSKEDLEKFSFKESYHQEEFSIYNSVSKFTQRLRSAQKKSNEGFYKVFTSHKEISSQEWRIGLGTFQEIDDNGSNVGQGLKEKLNDESFQVLKSDFEKAVPFNDYFKKGFNFDFDFSGSNTNTVSTPKYAGPKYGLVLQDIEAPESSIAHVSTNPISDSDLQYASKADLKWTIGPLQKKKKVFTTSASSSRVTEGFLNDFSLPKPSFKFNMAASTPVASQEDLQNLGLALTMTQKEGFYTYKHITKDKEDNKVVTHTFAVPVVNNTKVEKIYDEEGRALKTSINNIFGNKDGMMVNCFYLDTDSRYGSEANYKEGVYNFNLKIDYQTATNDSEAAPNLQTSFSKLF